MPRSPLPLTALLLTACATRPSTLPDDPCRVLVKSVRLPDRDWLPWFTRFAEHAWVEVRLGDQATRIEWNKYLDAIAHTPLRPPDLANDERWERGVAVHAEWTGERARELGERILAVAHRFPDATGYRAWPGPNSNTFVAWLAREVGMGVLLPPTAVGKDYTPWLAAGLSSTRLGLHVDTALLGAQVGLVEGVELHLLGLTAGIALWPPALELPFLPAFPGGWFALGSSPTAEPQ